MLTLILSEHPKSQPPPAVCWGPPGAGPSYPAPTGLFPLALQPALDSLISLQTGERLLTNKGSSEPSFFSFSHSHMQFVFA